MNMRSRMPLAVALTLLGLLAATAAAQEEGEWVRPYPPFLPGLEPVDEAGRKTAVSFRLLRETERGSIWAGGGRVSFHTEECGPLALGARLLASGRVDEFGFANLERPDEEGSHWHFEAPGHGVRHEYYLWEGWDGIGGNQILLPGAVDRTIRVLDPVGRPLADARVEMYLGCPHSPAVRSGTTDSAGIVRLPNLPADRERDFWIEAPGIRFGPYILPRPRVGEPYRTILTDFGRTARGIVRDWQGCPLAGVVVRGTYRDRGPVTTTDAGGHFTLHGLIARDAVAFHDPESTFGPRPGALVADFSEDVPLQVILHRNWPTALGSGAFHHLVDILTVTREKRREDGPLTDQAFSGAPVRMARLADGFTVTGKTGRIGEAEGVSGRLVAMVPPGTYRITAGGGFCEYAAVTVTVELPRPCGLPVRIVLGDRQPYLWLRMGREDHIRAPRKGELRIPGAVKEIYPRQAYAESLPAKGPAALLVGPHGPYPIGPLVDRRRSLEWSLPTPNRIRFRVRDEEGEEVEPDTVYLDWESVEPRQLTDGSWVVDTYRAGKVRLSLDLDLDSPEIEVDLPGDAPGVVDLGVLVVRQEQEDEERPEKPVTILDAEGDPLVGEKILVTVRRHTWEEEWTHVEADEDGMYWIARYRDPVLLLVEGEGIYPLRAEMTEEGPSEIRLPAGRIRGEVRSLGGARVPAVVYVDAHRFTCEEGRIDIRGVPAGPHVVIVGARDHVGEVRRVVLGDGEGRYLAVSLSPR